MLHAVQAWEPALLAELLRSQLQGFSPSSLPEAYQDCGRELRIDVCMQINRAVQAWEPREEVIPLHTWLHPWLELLGRQLEDLYPTIRFKLATALQAWHPSDGSALTLLSPWHTVHPDSIFYTS